MHYTSGQTVVVVVFLTLLLFLKVMATLGALRLSHVYSPFCLNSTVTSPGFLRRSGRPSFSPEMSEMNALAHSHREPRDVSRHSPFVCTVLWLCPARAHTQTHARTRLHEGSGLGVLFFSFFPSSPFFPDECSHGWRTRS